ncbi:hypothetical protein H6761_00550 [Candidatus Nomurabacteria bacterium]|nr:hypothetical protein [Candidatus Nomurabacteria bacterium]
MYQKLDKVLALVAKTGDKIIVVSETHDPCVVMSLSDYDHLLTSSASLDDLTEEQLMNKINRDIAIWKAAQTEEIQSNGAYDLDQFKLDNFSKNQENLAETDSLEISKADVDNSSVAEEEKYYIEPID